MKTEMWSVEKIKPYEKNPRKNENAVEAVAKSIAEFGFRVPLVVDADGVIIAGHTRLKAAEKLGLKKVPVHVARELSPEQVKALRIADNKLHELSSWDLDLLPLELADLKGAGFDLSLLGFSTGDLDALLAPAGTEGLTDPDDIPAPPDAATTKPGDLWILGDHRLLCGDSRSADHVARVMNGEVADLVVTDPPYGVAYQSKLSVEEAVARRRRKDGLDVANDDLDADGTLALVSDALTLARGQLRDGGAFYICAPAGSSESGDMGLVFRMALVRAGLRLRQAIVWVKDVFVMGRQDYHWRHEDLLYGWKDGAAHFFVEDRTQDTVWEIPRPKRSEDHPTMKPVALMARAIGNSSRRGDLVYEPFSGSGTTLIACEQLGRRCYAIELDPRYVDVCVARWEKYTGRRAEREGHKAKRVGRSARRRAATEKAPARTGACGER